MAFCVKKKNDLIHYFLMLIRLNFDHVLIFALASFGRLCWDPWSAGLGLGTSCLVMSHLTVEQSLKSR